MLKVRDFYKEFEAIPQEDRFRLIELPAEPTSLFVIFKQLGEVRAQKRFFEERESHLLKLAEAGLKQLNGQ